MPRKAALILISETGLLPERIHILLGGCDVALRGLLGFVEAALIHLLEYGKLIRGAFNKVVRKQTSQVCAGGFAYVAGVFFYQLFFA